MLNPSAFNDGKSFADAAKRKPAIGLTSLIDVVFILLLFFMLSSTFAPQSALNIQSASSGAGTTMSEVKPLLINVIDNNTWRINGKSCDVHSDCIARVLADARANKAQLGLRAEGSATIQALVTALSLLESQGLTGAQLLESTAADNVR